MQNILPELLPDIADDYNCKIILDPSLSGKTEALMKYIGFTGKKILVVCDQETYAVLGKRVIKEIQSDFLILEGKPHADIETVNFINTHEAEVLLAVGSGTISDLCKYASCLTNKGYAVFPTAPSMNGYFSANASITVNGHKQTLPAHLPEGIFCDFEVLTHAPRRLILSGLGDSLCRSTAQADWLLSHFLFATSYSPLPFAALKPYEDELFNHADKLVAGDSKVIELLMRTLLISGMGMVLAGGSYPASQGEHLIAHTMEIKHGSALPETYHGEQIGVTTLIMAGIQQDILSKKIHLKKDFSAKDKIATYFGKELEESINNAYQSKLKLYELYDAIKEKLDKEESAIREGISQIALPERYLRSILQKTGAPITAKELGWQNDALQHATKHAKFIRNRFTFLDLM